jgi:hypothetical protein
MKPYELVFFLLALALVGTRASAYVTGPPPGHTGAPGDATCTSCHFSYPKDDKSGGIAFYGLPESYEPGKPIEFLVVVFQDGTDGLRKDWGFQLTVLDFYFLFRGTLVATDAENTQVVTDGDRYYLEQTLAGSFYDPEGAYKAAWKVTWIPPDRDVGPVTFYAAGNAGNGDFTRRGDYIFTTNQMVMGPGGEAPR